MATATTVIALSLSGVSTASAADRQSFAGAVPRWATPAHDAGVTAPTASVEGEIYLPLRDQPGAEAYATAASTPGSSAYRQFLSPTAWIDRFSPTQADSDAVVASLTAKGLTVSAVPASRQYVVFRGTATQLGALFATSLHDYNYSGHVLAAPSKVPSVPARSRESASTRGGCSPTQILSSRVPRRTTVWIRSARRLDRQWRSTPNARSTPARTR